MNNVDNVREGIDTHALILVSHPVVCDLTQDVVVEDEPNSSCHRRLHHSLDTQTLL